MTNEVLPGFVTKVRMDRLDLTQPATPAHHRPWLLGVLAILGGVFTLIMGTATVVRLVTTGPPSVMAGGCLRFNDDTVRSAPCDRADVKITRVLPGGRSGDFQRCPQDTDGAAEFDGGRTACVRNLDGDHPGDPGNGGGVLRSGDCVNDPDAGANHPDQGDKGNRDTQRSKDGRPDKPDPAGSGDRLTGKNADDGPALVEVPCEDPERYAVILAVTGTPWNCPPDAVEYLRLADDTLDRPVLCLGSGPGVAESGDCLPAPGDGTRSRVPVSCLSGDRAVRVRARASDASACPPGTFTEDDPRGLPGRWTLCVQWLRH
jgi:hypothetical protein